MANNIFKSLIGAVSQFNAPLINYQPSRNRLWSNVRPILGWPRKTLQKLNRPYPQAHKYNWRPYLPEDEQYTIRPLPIYKMGGRDLVTGRVVTHTLGGGNPKKFRWVDTYRRANEDGSPRQEEVLMIKYDPLRTPRLALVADHERKRWIFASHEISKGDIITTYSDIPRNPVLPKVGDAHPIGALPVGTLVNQIETTPGEGAAFCVVAGASATITKRAPDGVTIKMRHGDSWKLDRACMCVVGQLSNVGQEHVHLWCPQRKRWMGKRPNSGYRHKKDGYCGRKVYPPKFTDATKASIEAKLAKQRENNPFEFL